MGALCGKPEPKAKNTLPNTGTGPFLANEPAPNQKPAMTEPKAEPDPNHKKPTQSKKSETD
jgi:hypothetical protein